MRLQNGNLKSNLMNEVEWKRQPHKSNYDINNKERDLRMYRSGSAPPTIEGSYNAISNLFRNLDFPNGGMSEEEMRSHPAYLSYYYSHDNINPRLPPPLLSKEEWRMHQRLRNGGTGLPFVEMPNWKKRVVLDHDEYADLSLFPVQPTTSIQKEDDGINMDPTTMNMNKPSCNASTLWLDDMDHAFARQGGTRLGRLGIRSKSFADILLDGSNRPTNLLSSTPRQASYNISYDLLDSCNPSFQSSELWNERKHKQDLHMRAIPNFNGAQNHHTMASTSFPSIKGSSFSRCSMPELSRVSIPPTHPSKDRFFHVKQQLLGKSTSPKLVDYPSSMKASTNPASKENSTRIKGFNEQNLYNNTTTHVVPNHTLRGGQNGKCGNKIQLNNHYSEIDSTNVQYYNHLSNQNLLLGRKYISASHGELSRPQKDQLDTLIYGQRRSCGLPLPQKGHVINDGYFDGITYLFGMPYQGTSMTNSLTAMQYTNPMLQTDVSTIMKDRIGMTLLEEFKNKTRSFELSDIVGHVVEFSVDQCGSRFIQQKLEIATNEESMKVFPEIIPHARTLMTDVFGNYVIQKIFERGTKSQRNMLVSQIKSHVLQLSLQMYGCRVIQKALETLDLEEKTHIVAELDGSILKCVRDQNGNHVIQKCVECVPEDKIQYIISSFFGQVVPLSTHPYGCRVIQRVLEHCNKENTKKRIMSEIMQSICTLAQDQYGNYVIQHVIQHGKPKEKSIIITKLEGQIVKMSQQKFASNVIEKCLTFGNLEERQAIVNEMLVCNDQSDPLQVMMKDPFGNYVVQKVLETCDEETRELILSRIKLHLNDLKKYTYVKHVVARVEKLLVTVEG